MLQRAYIDSSVIGGCFDREFSEWSRNLFEEFKRKLKIAVVSDLTYKELEDAPRKVRENLFNLPKYCVENVVLTEESEKLATEYISSKVIKQASIVDAQHIAIATIERVDVLLSWNFKHIVNLNRIHGYNSVNIRLGYPILEIRTPREAVNG